MWLVALCSTQVFFASSFPHRLVLFVGFGFGFRIGIGFLVVKKTFVFLHRFAQPQALNPKP